MKKTHITFAGLILIAALFGCAQISNQLNAQSANEPEKIEIFQEPDDLIELMHYYNSLQTKSSIELAEEYQYANSHYHDSIDIQQRLKLVILLLLPDTKFQSTRTALTLIENLPDQDKIAPAAIGFRDMLLLLLKQHQADNVKIQDLSTKLRMARTEVKALQDKIDAIKNIEKNLMRKSAF